MGTGGVGLAREIQSQSSGGSSADIVGVSGVTIDFGPDPAEVSNDLVTGVQVTDITALATGDAIIRANNTVILRSVNGLLTVQNTTSGGINIQSNNDDVAVNAGAAINLTAETNIDQISNAGDIGLFATIGNVSISAPVAGVTIAAGTTLALTSDDDITLITAGSGDTSFTTRDETHTLGRNFSVTAAGATGIQLATTHASSGNIALATTSGNITLDAGGDGNIVLTVGAGVFSIFGAAGAGQAAAISTGGGTLAEVKAAVDDIIADLQAWGWMEP